MEFTLTPAADHDPEDTETTLDPATEFSLSPQPLVLAESEGDRTADELPRSYHTGTLCLMARDPQHLFAYWDIDWAEAFGEATPRERKVHLRIFRANGSMEVEIEVQPLAGGEIIEVAAANDDYTAEIGCRDATDKWKSIATSRAVTTPTALPTDGFEAKTATIPFHISFQQMLDVLSTPDERSEPLTTRLNDLRTRAHREAQEFTVQQRQLVDSIDEMIAQTPPPAPAAQIEGARERLVRLLGFSASSLSRAFGGSSR